MVDNLDNLQGKIDALKNFQTDTAAEVEAMAAINP